MAWRRRRSRRFQRYKAKTDPETTYRLLLLTRGIQLQEEAKYQPLLHELNMTVKEVCCRHGVPSIYHHYYVHYAQGLLYLKLRLAYRRVSPEADALYCYWWLRGLDPQVLEEIGRRLGFEVGELLKRKIIEAINEAHVIRADRVFRGPFHEECVYDEAGNLTKIIITDKVTGKRKEIALTYDEAGNLVSVDEVLVN